MEEKETSSSHHPVTVHEQCGMNIALIAAAFSSALSEKFNSGFSNHNSHIDIFKDMAILATYAESMLPNVIHVRPSEIESFANTLTTFINDDTYCLVNAEKMLRMLLNHEDIVQWETLKHFDVFIYEAESAAAMASALWNVSNIQNKKLILIEMAKFAQISSQIYSNECMQDLGVWLYDVDAVIGEFIVEAFMNNTYSEELAKSKFESTLRDLFKKEPHYFDQIQPVLNKYFPAGAKQ